MAIHGKITNGRVELLDPLPEQWGDGAEIVIEAARTEHELVRQFEALSTEWMEATKYRSFSHQIALHPAYQRIIGLGASVLPLIFRELEDAPQHWFWALRAITGEDPVPAESRGNVSAATEAWLEWGRQHLMI